LRQPQHCFARFRVLAIGQAERFAAQTKLGRIGVGERAPLGAILVLDRNRYESVSRDQDVGEDQPLEVPVVRHERVFGGISERRRHWIAGLPHLHFAVIAGEAKEIHAGTLVGCIDVRPVFLQIAMRMSFDIPTDEHCRRSDTRYRTQLSEITS
jgi:hypothetical protein